MSIAAGPQQAQAPVAMFKAAGDALRRQDRVAADALVLALRAFGADGPPHAGFYADVLDARLAMAVDDVDAAIRHLEGARARLAETPATEHAQMALAHAESRMLLATMRPADALHVLEEAWALRDAVDDPRLCLACALMICHCFKRLERWSDAEPWQDIAVAMARQQGWRAQLFELQTEAAGAFLEEGDHLARQGRLEQAQDRWRAAASTFDALVSDPCFGELRPYNRVVFLCDHASSLSRVGRGAEALPLVERCFELSAGFVDHDLRIALHLAKANVLRDLQRLDEATAEAGLAASLAQQHKVPRHLCEAFTLLSTLAERQGDLAAALAHLRAFIRMREDLAFEEAQKRSAASAVKLQMQRALNDAAQAREQAASMEREAQADGLTGLANRRRFDRHLAAVHAEARMRHAPLCVAMLDVDHFKRVNDTFGHGAGDEVLRRLGAILLAQCRGTDVAARIGGEEFAVVFDGIGLRRALEVCERLRAAVEAAPWAGIAPGLAVTISTGLYDVGAHDSIAEGLAKVDGLLYEAKRSGRNRVVPG